MSRIPYTRPSITDLEIRYATDAVRDGWGERCYDYIVRLEAAFRDHLQVEHAIATSSGTGALHLGLAGLGIGPGDEVILAESNWIASAAPIAHLGARPVIVDVRRDTWCIDPARAEEAVTPRTKAILAVHLYGNMCDMDALRDIGERRGIAIVEDAAEALGSRWGKSHAGGLGVFGTFSFHGTKTMTTGEGGMFVTGDRALYERVLTLSNHGRARGETRQFWPSLLGFKYKLSNVAAAIGCAQLERLPELLAAKRRIFAYYAAALADLPLRMNPEPTGTTNGFWMPTMVADDGVAFDRDRLIEVFNAEGIDGRVFFWPLSDLPMFTPIPTNRIARVLSRRGMNLPSYHDMTDADMDRVIHCVRKAFRG